MTGFRCIIIVAFTTIAFATLKNGEDMFRDRIILFPQFIKKIFYEHNISKLDPGINQTQTNILMIINESNEKSMSEISLMTGLEKSSFTRSVDHLVKNEFITRNSPEKDRRKITLSLTNKGIKSANLIKNEFDIYLESLLSDFSKNQKKEFLDSLDVISKYINIILEKKI